MQVISDIKNEINRFNETYKKEILKHNKILKDISGSSEKSFLEKINNYEKTDLEFVSQIAKITNSKGNLINISLSPRNKKKNLEWYEKYKKAITTGFTLINK
jgi:hypothetical protein